MRIEIIKNKETSLVIDDIGKAIEEDNILKDGYEKAIRALKRYIEQAGQVRDKLERAQKTDSQINDILYQSPHNIIAFTGKRGTGKTSAMLSFTEFLKARGNKCDMSREIWKEKFADLQMLVLSPIDPTMLENDQDILGVVLSRLLYKAEERWLNNPSFYRAAQNLEKEKNELLKKANDCLNGIQAVKRKGDIKNLADLQRVGDSAVLKKNLFDLVDQVNEFCLGNDIAIREDRYLVIPIDDTDCQIRKAHDVMEDIRRYLTIPNVIIVMATDGNMLRAVFAQHYADEFKTGLDREFIEKVNTEHYAEKYLTKLIPGTHRIHLPAFESIMKGNSVRLELGYYEDESRNKDLISGSDKISRDQKRQEQDYSGKDFDFQAKILDYIYQKTGIVFFEHSAYINSIIPTTLRGLSHLLNFLYSMGEVEVIDYSRKYKLAELIKKNRNRLNAIERNLDLFEEYFMNEWVPAKVSGKMRRILEGIEEQVPENVIKYAYDEIYKLYIIGDGKDIDEDKEPKKIGEGWLSNPSYYDLMDLMGGINDSIEIGEISPKYRHREDYYNTFAVRTLLTIKNNKESVRTRKKKFENLRNRNSSLADLKYSQSDWSKSLPHDTLKKENSDGMGEYNFYNKTLMPIVDICISLLQNNIEYKKKAQGTGFLCLHEIAWIVICNWDVQDAIYKIVESYLNDLNEKYETTQVKLWDYIFTEIGKKNCGMLRDLMINGGREIDKWPEISLTIFNSNNNMEPIRNFLDDFNKNSIKAEDYDLNSMIDNLIYNIDRKLGSKNNINVQLLKKDLNLLVGILEIKKKQMEKILDGYKLQMTSDDIDKYTLMIKQTEKQVDKGNKIIREVETERNQFSSENDVDIESDLNEFVVSDDIKINIKEWTSEILISNHDADPLLSLNKNSN